jgi:hypothetical protein
MRRVGLIVIVIAVCVAGYGAKWLIELQLAKAKAEKKFADGKAFLNSVPSPACRKLSTIDYTNVTWITMTNARLGFPTDRFTRDSNPKRENLKLHHDRYNLLIFPGHSAAEWAPVTQPLEETNFYRFNRAVFNATERDIRSQWSIKGLYQHLTLLEAKWLIAKGRIEEGCFEFDRDGLKGFIVGDPKRFKQSFILVYLESQKQFVDIGVISKVPLEISALEELVSVLKVDEK